MATKVIGRVLIYGGIFMIADAVYMEHGLASAKMALGIMLTIAGVLELTFRRRYADAD